MPRPRFRLRSLMFLVLFAALGMAGWSHLSGLETDRVIARLVMLGPFLLVIALKAGLVFGLRLRRAGRDEATDRAPGDRPQSPSSSDLATGG